MASQWSGMDIIYSIIFNFVILIHLKGNGCGAVNLTVDISPGETIEEGSRVSLTCRFSQTQIVNPIVIQHLKKDKCSLFWSRTYYPGRQSKHEVIHDTNSIYLDRKLISGTRIPYSITVTIPALHQTDIATYSCNFICERERKNVTIDLQAFASQKDIGYSATLLSSITCLFVILTLLVTVVAVSCHQHRRVITQSNLQTRGSQEDLLSVCPHDGNCRCSQCILYDPPPRYSVVAGQPSSSVPGPSTPAKHSSCSSGAQSQQQEGVRENPEQTVITVNGNTSDMAVRRQESFTKPPGYEEALEYLQQSGVSFNPETLSPMPPAYNEAATGAHPASSGITCLGSINQMSLPNHSTDI